MKKNQLALFATLTILAVLSVLLLGRDAASRRQGQSLSNPDAGPSIQLLPEADNQRDPASPLPISNRTVLVKEQSPIVKD